LRRGSRKWKHVMASNIRTQLKNRKLETKGWKNKNYIVKNSQKGQIGPREYKKKHHYFPFILT